MCYAVLMKISESAQSCLSIATEYADPQEWLRMNIAEANYYGIERPEPYEEALEFLLA